MGFSLQRLEVLLISLILLLAGGLVVVLSFLPSPAASPYSATHRDQHSPSANTASLATATPLDIATDVDTVSPQPMVKQPAPAAPFALSDAAPTFVSLFASVWPYVVCGVLLSTGLVMIRWRRQRMPYTGQNVAQLLAAANPETRATNLRVMRELAAQGRLTPELAAAAGIHPGGNLLKTWLILRTSRITHRSRSALDILKWQVPAWRLLKRNISWHFVRSSLPWHHLTLQRPQSVAGRQTIGGENEQLMSNDRPSVSTKTKLTTADQRMPGVTAAHDRRATPVDVHAPWTPEDRAIAVAGALHAIWTERQLTSAVLALDTAQTPGTSTVFVTIEVCSDEDEALHTLPEWAVAACPGWLVEWRGRFLAVTIATTNAPPTTGPLLAPILIHGRRGRMLRFYPFDYWRHLALFGGEATSALHTILGSLLYAQPPERLALCLLDNGQLRSLYRDVAHSVPAPHAPRETLAQLLAALRRESSTIVRPLVLVVFEPDEDVLPELTKLVVRLRAMPTAPIHLILVQEQLHAAGRELYALLPALITANGRGPASLLPGQSVWPTGRAARLVGRGMRLEGQLMTTDEAAIATQLAALRAPAGNLPPVLWDTLAEITSNPDDGQYEENTAPTDAAQGASDGLDSAAPAESGTDPNSAGECEPLPPTISNTAWPSAPNLQATEPEPNTSWLGSLVARAALPRDEQHDPVQPDAFESEAASISTTSDTDAHWPSAPAPLDRAGLAAFITNLVGDDEVLRGVGGDVNSVGVTKNRVVRLLNMPRREGRDLAEVVLCWLDQAGVLAEPTRPGARLRHPRPLRLTTLEDIALRLAATPIPDQGAVCAAWAEDNEGGR